MKCKEMQKNLSCYLDGELTEEEQDLLEEHLATCSLCQAELSALQAMVSQFAALEQVDPPASLRYEFHTKLIEEGRSWGQKLGLKLKNLRQYPVFYPVIVSLLFFFALIPFLTKSVPWEEELKDNGVQEEFYEIAPLAREGHLMMDAVDVVPEMLSVKQLAGPIMLTPKLIKNAEIVLAVDDYQQVATELKNKVEVLQGYITNEQVEVLDERGSKQAYLQIRIPQIKFAEFLVIIEDLGKLKNSNVYTEDVTEEYIDVESRLRVLQTKEARLLAILAQSGELSDVLAVENELAQTRSQLESGEGRLRYLSNQTEFATFNLSIKQNVAAFTRISTKGLEGIGGRAKEAFVRAINNIFIGFGLAFVFLSAALPYLFLGGLLGFFIWRIVLKLKK